jgi:hypothetical protein
LQAAPQVKVKLGLSKSCSISLKLVEAFFKEKAGVSGSKKSSVVKKLIDPLQITLPPGQTTPEALPNVVGCWAAAGKGVNANGQITVQTSIASTVLRISFRHMFFLLRCCRLSVAW